MVLICIFLFACIRAHIHACIHACMHVRGAGIRPTRSHLHAAVTIHRPWSSHHAPTPAPDHPAVCAALRLFVCLFVLFFRRRKNIARSLFTQRLVLPALSTHPTLTHAGQTTRVVSLPKACLCFITSKISQLAFPCQTLSSRSATLPQRRRRLPAPHNLQCSEQSFSQHLFTEMSLHNRLPRLRISPGLTLSPLVCSSNYMLSSSWIHEGGTRKDENN